MDKTKDIVKYVHAHLRTTTVFVVHSSNLALKISGPTRFATNFLIIEHLIKVKHALKQPVIYPDWIVCINKLNHKRNI